MNRYITLLAFLFSLHSLLPLLRVFVLAERLRSSPRVSSLLAYASGSVYGDHNLMGLMQSSIMKGQRNRGIQLFWSLQSPTAPPADPLRASA